MNTRGTAIKAAILAVIAAAVLIAAAACANPVATALNSRSWGLVGTWVNSSYGGFMNLPKCPKVTIYSDGSFMAYDFGATATSTGTYTIDSVSASGNARTYQVHFSWAAGVNNSYSLLRITGGTTFETESSSTLPYAPAIDPANISYTYAIYSPQ
jgi:TRAP-type mannitol/chloroaromatic compound transport system substrate-binding protein